MEGGGGLRRRVGDVLVLRGGVQREVDEGGVGAPARQRADDAVGAPRLGELARLRRLGVLLRLLEQLRARQRAALALGLVAAELGVEALPLAAEDGVLAARVAVAALGRGVRRHRAAREHRLAVLVRARDAQPRDRLLDDEVAHDTGRAWAAGGAAAPRRGRRASGTRGRAGGPPCTAARPRRERQADAAAQVRFGASEHLERAEWLLWRLAWRRSSGERLRLGVGGWLLHRIARGRVGASVGDGSWYEDVAWQPVVASRAASPRSLLCQYLLFCASSASRNSERGRAREGGQPGIARGASWPRPPRPSPRGRAGPRLPHLLDDSGESARARAAATRNCAREASGGGSERVRRPGSRGCAACAALLAMPKRSTTLRARRGAPRPQQARLLGAAVPRPRRRHDPGVAPSPGHAAVGPRRLLAAVLALVGDRADRARDRRRGEGAQAQPHAASCAATSACGRPRSHRSAPRSTPRSPRSRARRERHGAARRGRRAARRRRRSAARATPAIYVLHTVGAVGGGRKLADGLIVGSALPLVEATGRAEPGTRVRVFGGSCDWGPMQLDGEIRRGSWAVVGADRAAPLVFATRLEDMWKAAAASPGCCRVIECECSAVHVCIAIDIPRLWPHSHLLSITRSRARRRVQVVEPAVRHTGREGAVERKEAEGDGGEGGGRGGADRVKRDRLLVLEATLHAGGKLLDRRHRHVPRHEREDDGRERAPATPMMRKAITVPCTALYTALDRMGPKTQKRKTISQSRVRRAHHAGVQQASAERSSRLIGHFEMTCVSASAVVSTAGFAAVKHRAAPRTARCRPHRRRCQPP